MIRARLRAVLKHKISQNVIALYWVQMATFVVPLITLPYVSRVLGPSQFGLVLFSQSFSIFLMLFIDWGFTPYGVRQVARDRHDPEALRATVGHVRTAQLLMVALSVPVVIGAYFLLSKFNRNPGFLGMAWLSAVANGLMANWYFVGVERVRITSMVQLGLRFFGAALTFIFVRNSSDAWLVMAFYTLTSVGTWLVSDVLVHRWVGFSLRSLRRGANATREAGRLFVGTVSLSLLSTFNVVLLGFLVPSAQVADFGSSERLVRTCEQLTGPVGVATYPRLAFLHSEGRPDRARRLAWIAILGMTAGGVLLAAVFAAFAPTWILIIFGPKFVHGAAPILRILSLLIPFNILCTFLAFWLMTLQKDKVLVRLVLAVGLFNVTLGTILTKLMGPQGMAWSVVTAQALAAVAGAVVIYRIPDPDKSLFPRRRHRHRAHGFRGWPAGAGRVAADGAQIHPDYWSQMEELCPICARRGIEHVEPHPGRATAASGREI